MAKVTWKRTRRGIEFVEKKSVFERLQDMTFMQTALTLFGVEAALFFGALAWSIATGGNAPWPVSLFGIAILVLGIIGVCVTLYGHYSVEAKSRVNWRIGLITNGGAAAGMLILSIIGLVVR